VSALGLMAPLDLRPSKPNAPVARVGLAVVAAASQDRFGDSHLPPQISNSRHVYPVDAGVGFVGLLHGGTTGRCDR
jgi:hypothetical protein